VNENEKVEEKKGGKKKNKKKAGAGAKNQAAEEEIKEETKVSHKVVNCKYALVRFPSPKLDQGITGKKLSEPVNFPKAVL
jgi:hypothetical protein